MLRSRLAVCLVTLAMMLACASSPELEPADPAPVEREIHTLTYRQGPEGTLYTPWQPGDKLYLGVDGANLREGPSTDAPVRATVALGTLVEIEEVASDTVTLIERQNRWYRVRADGRQGYLFGALLTPVSIWENLDGDPDIERIAVTFSPDFVPRVRVMEPGFDAEDDRVVTLDLPMAVSGRGGRLRAQVLPGQKTAWKVVHVELCTDDGCASQLVAYLLPRPDRLGYLSSLEARPEQVTFVPEGLRLVEVAEPFLAVRGLLSNGPCTDCDQLLVRGYAEPETVIDHQYPGERDVGPRLLCQTVGKVHEGWFSGKELVACSRDGMGPVHFVAHEKHWLQIEEDNAHVTPLVSERGVRVEKGDLLRISLQS